MKPKSFSWDEEPICKFRQNARRSLWIQIWIDVLESLVAIMRRIWTSVAFPWSFAVQKVNDLVVFFNIALSFPYRIKKKHFWELKSWNLQMPPQANRSGKIQWQPKRTLSRPKWRGKELQRRRKRRPEDANSESGLPETSNYFSVTEPNN